MTFLSVRVSPEGKRCVPALENVTLVAITYFNGSSSFLFQGQKLFHTEQPSKDLFCFLTLKK